MLVIKTNWNKTILEKKGKEKKRSNPHPPLLLSDTGNYIINKLIWHNGVFKYQQPPLSHRYRLYIR